MDPYIQQWAQSGDAQPYLQQVMGQSAQGSYGMGGGDPYSDYLMQLINSNPEDQRFQDQMLGYYLDYTNPQNQRGGLDENTLNTALSLLSSEDPSLKEWGKMLLAESFPQLGESGYGAPQTYEDMIRKEAQTVLEDPSMLSRNEFDWNSYLANKATPQQISAYDQDPTLSQTLGTGEVDYWANALAGMGGGAAIGAGIGSVVPGAGTLAGGAIGGAIGGGIGSIRTLIQLAKAKEEARRSAAGFGGYSL